MTGRKFWAGIAFIVFAGVAGAQSADARREALRKQFEGMRLSPPAALLIASFDQNGDYQVDAEELDAGLTQAFETADENGDGALSLFEHEDWAALALGDRSALPGRLTLDRDSNSQISAEEFENGFRTLAQGYALETGDIPFARLTRPLPEFPTAGGLDRDALRREIQRRRGGRLQAAAS